MKHFAIFGLTDKQKAELSSVFTTTPCGNQLYIPISMDSGIIRGIVKEVAPECRIMTTTFSGDSTPRGEDKL